MRTGADDYALIELSAQYWYKTGIVALKQPIKNGLLQCLVIV
ncbi:MAG TPA: hypothetical protein PK074_12370 [Spirochaetales bacterium]|nr:hypothetical protein [Spirochaetales bacterium]